MYCPNCGAPAAGNFCSKCGHALTETAAVPAPETSPEIWADECRYAVLMRIPQIREQIAQAAQTAQKRLSAEDFLSAADTLISAVTPLKLVPFNAMASIAVPIFAHLGMKTGKTRSETLPGKPGTLIVNALCAMAAQGQTMKTVRQFDDGCMLEAQIPSDFWSWKGSLFVSIRKHGSGCQIDAATSIGGQLYDWGKSKRCLDDLFTFLKNPEQAIDGVLIQPA
jgi:hypothetical protein